MPYPNEHAARIKSPGQYDKFARKNIAPGIDIILGIKGDKSEIQAYRFKKDKFTEEQSRAWLKEKNISTISFEPASDSKNMMEDITEEEYEKQTTDIKQYISNEYRCEDLTAVEIFAAGRWKGQGSANGGDIYTEKDLDEMVNANKEIGHYIKPPMKLGHDPKQKMLQKDGYPRIGVVQNLRRIGKKLVADIKQVPGKIVELIKLGAYNRFSPEIAWDYEDTNNNKKFKRVLTGLALLGADLPACDSPNDFLQYLYGKNIDNIELCYGNDDNNNIKKYEIFEEYAAEKEVDIMELEKLKAEMAELQAKYDRLENANKEYEADLSKKDEELKLKEEAISAKEKELDDIRLNSKESEVIAFVDKALEDGKIVPAQRAYCIALGMGNDVKEDESGLRCYEYSENNEKKKIEYSSSFELMKNIIDNNEKPNLEEESKVGKEKKYSKKEDNDDGDIDNTMDNRIKEYMKENKVIDYSVAFDAIVEEDRQKKLNDGGDE